jgi:uncharacterized protein (DUF885 family)
MDSTVHGEEVSSDAPDLSEWRAAPSEMRDLLLRYETDRHSLERKYPIEMSSVRRARMKRFYTSWQTALEQIAFDTLLPDDRIDCLLFTNHLRHELRQLDLQADRLEEMSALLPFAQAILGLEEERQRMEWVAPEKAADLLNALETQIDQTREKVEAALTTEDGAADGAWKPTVANRAAEAVKQLQKTLKHWSAFYQGYDPLFTWWVEEPYRGVEQALTRYADFLREKVVGVKADDAETIIGDPIGREALMVELAFEMIPYTPEELIAIADQELAWCEAEMRRASRDLGYGDDWREALEHVKTLHVEPGRQPEIIRELALEAIAFLEERDLVTIPPLARETWRMEMMSPEKQLVNPFFLGGEMIQVSFPTHTMTHAQKQMSLRGNNVHFARATVQHELIPGHHLQGYMMQRYRTYRQVLHTSFWVEGWALYWEMLLWDLGFPNSPENRIGMLFWRIHRCARIVFSLSFHLERMTPQECVAFLVDRVGHERANATAEVRRSFNGDYSPLYQCAYQLGGLQIRALRRELVDTGRMTERAFHDAILKENSIPIEMVRAGLTQQALARDFVSRWKFYGPIAGKE